MSDSIEFGSVADQWTFLRAGSRDSGGLEIPSMPVGVSAATGPIRLAIGQSGEARLLLPLAAHEKPVGIDAGGALEVTVSSFMQSGRAYRFLDLICLSVELEPVFGEVVDEIIARISDGISCIEAARTTFEDFRALLTATPLNHIDRRRVVGLVAELLVLNRLLDESPSAWQAWQGPTGDRHDFRAGDKVLEIKASLRAGSAGITINSLEQLESPSGGTLHLAHFTLEAASGGFLTVAGLGGQALSKADDPTSVRDLLAAVGCPNVEAEEWNRDAFRNESESLYRVEAGFPRIVPSMFAGGHAPAGVGELTYQIDLSVASAFKCSADELNSLFQTLAAGS